LQRTEKTQSGAQHPSYDIQLQGSGDLVMTDVRSTRSGIVFDEPIDGRLFVRDQNDRLVVELNKLKDHAVEIGLSAGTYTITREAKPALSMAKVSVAEGQRVSLDERAFITVDRERTARRGPELATVIKPNKDTVRVPAVLSFAGGWHTARAKTMWPTTALSLGFLHSRVFDLNGFGFVIFANNVKHNVNGIQLSFGGNVAGEMMHGVQSAIAFNHAGSAFGAQLAWGVNSAAKRMEGVQLAVAANLTRDWHRGLQASFGFNYADGLTGAQISTVNVAKGMRGIQIGLVNVASNVDGGFQLGLINVAKSMKGASLGLFSLVADEPIRLAGRFSRTLASL